MTVVNGQTEFKFLDVKRCYLPGLLLTTTCSKCNAIINVDFRDEYIPYPVVNANFGYTVLCHECGKEQIVPLFLELKLYPGA